MGAIGMQHLKLKRNLTIAGFVLGTSIYIPTAQAEPYTLVTNVVWKLTESGDLQVDLGGRFHVIERGQFLIDGADLYINRNEISDVDWSSLIAAGAVVSSAGGLWLFAALASGNGEAAQAISGVAIKGPLNNAFVFLDENGNETFDVGELSTTTNSTGGFDLSVGSRTGEIFVITNDNTIDTATGAMLSGVTLRSSMDSTVVSPLTTLKTPSGRPASLSQSASSRAAEGTRSDGFRIKQLPVTRAIGNIHMGTMAGKLNGVIPATTPTGCRIE